jgi:hypothetical protein
MDWSTLAAERCLTIRITSAAGAEKTVWGRKRKKGVKFSKMKGNIESLYDLVDFPFPSFFLRRCNHSVLSTRISCGDRELYMMPFQWLPHFEIQLYALFLPKLTGCRRGTQ